MQPDTIIPDLSNLQSWNRYSYVYNNSIRFTDPSGHACVEGTSYCVNSSTGQTSGSLTSYNDTYTGGGEPPDDVDEILGDDGSDDCTSFYTCVPDCSDPSWGCVTDVSGTWEDPAVYISIAFGGWGSGLFSTTFWGVAAQCIGNAICRWVTGMAGGAGVTSTTYTRYMTKGELDAINESGGFLRGGNSGATYFTSQNYGTVNGSQQALSLKTPPEIAVQFQVLNNPNISGPSIVEKIPGLTSGGGIEYWTSEKVQVLIIKIWELIQ